MTADGTSEKEISSNAAKALFPSGISFLISTEV